MSLCRRRLISWMTRKKVQSMFWMSFGEDEEGIVLQQRLPWEGTDRDYKYEELLGRVFNILREHNPELAGERRRTVMRPPQVLREGTKKLIVWIVWFILWM